MSKAVTIDSYERNVVSRLLKYKNRPMAKKRKKPNLSFGGKGENKLLEQNPYAFFLACQFDTMIKAKDAWKVPAELHNRMGHLDINKLSKMTVTKLERFIRGKKGSREQCLHRFPNRTASSVISNAIVIQKLYGGKAETLWETNSRNAGDVTKQLLKLRGFGQKLANMTTMIIGSEYGVPLQKWNEVDIAVDRHVARVFVRMGLIEIRVWKNLIPSIVRDQIINRARTLYPEFPGALDLSVFSIGLEWCKQDRPLCHGEGKQDSCPMESICKKINIPHINKLKNVRSIGACHAS